VILSATDALNWYSGIAGRSAADLSAELGDTLKAPSGVTFLPYLSGERTPHNDAGIRGAFAGLGHESSRVVLTQAVMEGVSFAIRDSLEALRAAGTTLSRVTAIGGGSRSRYWLKSIATALDLPVDLPDDGDFGAAFGAARLGLIAATDADPVATCHPPKTAETIAPEAGLVAAYEEAYQRYRRLYPAIKGATS
ncbi:MAG: FGGY-family carbohydrate kinase, partial [Ensifer adhaerens]